MADPSLILWLGAIIVIGFVALVAITNLWRSDKPHFTPMMWAATIILLPVTGLVIEVIAGTRGMQKPPSSPE